MVRWLTPRKIRARAIEREEERGGRDGKVNCEVKVKVEMVALNFNSLGSTRKYIKLGGRGLFLSSSKLLVRDFNATSLAYI